MGLFNNSHEALYLSYLNEELVAEAEVIVSVGSFQDFDINRFSKAAVNSHISVQSGDGNVIQYLRHPWDTAVDYLVVRAGDGRLRIHRVFKCSLKDEQRPFESYLRHNLSIQDYSSYFETLNSNAGDRLLPGDAVFLPELKDFLQCKDCVLESTQVWKQKQKRWKESSETLVEGVYCLYQPKKGTEPDFDVVFFHGLRVGYGHDQQWKTIWTTRGDEAEVWPETWLPKTFPNVRVLAVSYHLSCDSPAYLCKDWLKVSNNTFTALFTGSVGVGTRPYFFVGHSMGGLLVKEILMRADTCTTQIEHCRGLVFFGVPDHTATISDFVTLIRAVTYDIPGVSRVVIEDVQPFGIYCFERNRVFERFHKRLPVFSFLETRATLCGKILFLVPVKAMVVPRKIALYSWGSEFAFVDADHHDVCRLSKPTDVGFVKLRGFIRQQLPAALAVPEESLM